MRPPLLVPAFALPLAALAAHGAFAQRPTPGAIADVSLGAAPATANVPQEISVRSHGQCGQFKVEFGDGASATSSTSSVSALGNLFVYKLRHTYAAAGKVTVTVTGTLNCTGNASAVADVQAASAGISGGTPAVAPGGVVLPPPPLRLGSVSYAYPGLGELVAYAHGDTVTSTYPSRFGPKNGIVTFSFPSWGVPVAALESVVLRPCDPKLPGPCRFKFTWRKIFGDIGPVVDKSADAYTSVSSGPWTLHVRFSDLDLREFFKNPAQYEIHVEVTYQGVTYATKAAFVTRGAEVGKNYFEQFIYPTFQSARCTTCHSMGDHDAIVHQHEMNNVTQLSGSTVDVAPGKTAICANCHYPPRFNDWRTPPFSQGINWKQMKTWTEVCNTVVGHLSPTGLVDTPQTLAQLKQNMRNHFHNDPRVKWAIGDAYTAPPLAKQLDRAPPHSWDAWLALVDPWIDLDLHCPTE